MLRFFTRTAAAAPAPTTRFEAHQELKQIAYHLGLIKNKTTELESAKNENGAASLDYAKYVTMARLLKNLNDEMTRFNEEPSAEDQTQEARLVINLTINLEKILMHAHTHDGRILYQHRNDTQGNARSLTSAGMISSTLAAAYIAPVSILLKAGIVFSGLSSVDPVLRQVGLKDARTNTQIIIANFYDDVSKIKKNILLSLGEEPQALPNRVDNEREQHQPEQGELHVYSFATQSYLDSIATHEKATDRLNELTLSQDELEAFDEMTDPITYQVMNTPVMLAERAYDLETLIKLPIDENGFREEPFTKFKFHIIEIQPNRALYNKIHEKITEVARQHQAEQPEQMAHENPDELESRSGQMRVRP